MESIPTIDGLNGQELDAYIPVSMESCDEQPIGGKGLTTWGVQDCVVIALYNPTKGVFMGHFLRFNFFFPDKYSAACPKNSIEECKANAGAKKNLPVNPLECLGLSISESFPKWTKDAETECSMYSFQKEYLMERESDMKEYGFKGKINKYSPGEMEVKAVCITNNGKFGRADINEFSEISDKIKQEGKMKDLKIFLNQIFYGIKYGQYKLNNIQKNTMTKLQKYIEIESNRNIRLKNDTLDLKNFVDLQTLRGKFASLGLIFRECVYPKAGGRRKTRSINKKRQTRRK